MGTVRAERFGVAALILLAVAAAVWAGPDDPPPPVTHSTVNRNGDIPVPLLFPPPPEGLHVKGEESEHHHVRHRGDLLLEGDYLILAPRRTGQTYAIVGSNPLWGPIGIIKSLDGNYDSGFRVGAGWRFADEEWEMLARYTYYHAAASDLVGRPAGGSVFPTLTHPSTVLEVDSAAAANSINLNLVDVELARRFELSESFALRAFAGPRYAGLDQKLDVTYLGGDVARDDVRRRLTFDGGGIRAGGESHLKVLEHLGLYLRGSASLLTGRFHAEAAEVANDLTIVEVSEKFTRVVPVVDLGVGLSYVRGGCRLSVGYEFINWFNMVDGVDFLDDVHNAKLARPAGSLGFDGIVFRAEWAF